MIWPFKNQKPLRQKLAPDVADFAKYLGLNLTSYGVAVAKISAERGYRPAETASHFAVVTFARDVQAALNNIEDVFHLTPRVMATLECLKELKDKGFISPEIWQNDSLALFKIYEQNSETITWIEMVLSDPVVGKDAVAISRV